MAQAPAYVLDTNVLIHYARASIAGKAIEAKYQFQATAFKPFVCIVTVGEVLAFAQYRKWGDQRVKELKKLLENVVRLNIDAPEILQAYADLHTHCVTNGFKLSDNDLWIAATTQVTGACLITTDRDFDCLFPILIRRVFVDPKTGQIEDKP